MQAAGMTGAAEPTRPRRLNWDVGAAVLIVAVIVIHRAYVWWLFGGMLDHVAAVNPRSLIWLYLPARAYEEYMLSSLWYLQQTPPLPHVVLGLVVKWFGWPVGGARALYVVQFVISAATSVLLYATMRRLRCNIVVGLAVTLFFALSTDLLVMEVNLLGQKFYESAGMLAVTATAYCLCVALDGKGQDHERRAILLAGFWIATAALARASLCYLFAPLALVVAFVRGLRAAMIFLVPVVALHGAWALKTYFVYGYLTPATTSWSGIYATNSLTDPLKRDLVAMIVDDPKSTPWIARLLRDRGYIGWFDLYPPSYLPDDIRARQEEIQRILGSTNMPTNFLSTQRIAAEYSRVFPSLVMRHYSEVFYKFIRAYRIYWQAIGNYSEQYLGPLWVPPKWRNLLSLWPPWQPQDAKAMIATYPDKTSVDISLPSWPMRPLDSLCIWCLHILLPLVAATDLYSRWAGRPTMLDGKLVMLAVISGYGALVFNMFELGENMRFRLSVTPVNIALSIGLLAVVFAALWRLRTSRRLNS
jgi:hypothetical protein